MHAPGGWVQGARVKSPRQRHEGHCDLSLPSAHGVVEQAYLDRAYAETQAQVSERYALVLRAFGPGTDDAPPAGAAVVQRSTWAEVGSDPVAGEGRAYQRVGGPSGGLASSATRAAAHIVS